eukprot:CAMPEP_0113941342 /NCGR_PEP_ID=MMETSP1339-20121228/7281_1 /TAXON_ID=94617 /ORGANISM="Fibrocapsa japonica" /LENGTH=102 /DNA_ID=CAMNT_0000945457 /DNA_START=91 /DNA_END=399 /DNA_ORIENTATION=+ /assembly_acc=CAM_ASM_000762
MSMYVRVKRKNQTVFLHVEKSDNFAVLKQRCGEVINVNPSCIALYATPDKSKELVDMATVGDQQIENDSVIYMVTKKEGTESWEEIDVENFDGAKGEEKEEK